MVKYITYTPTPISRPGPRERGIFCIVRFLNSLERTLKKEEEEKGEEVRGEERKKRNKRRKRRRGNEEEEEEEVLSL